MSKLEIFQAAYGKDYVFTETELIKLMKIAELIVRECAEICLEANDYKNILSHFGVK